MKSIILIVAFVSLQGCASFLYMGGKVDKYSGGEYEKATHFESTPPLLNTVLYKVSKTNDETKNLIWEITPLGIVAPLFGYPLTDRNIESTFKFKLSKDIEGAKVFVLGGTEENGIIRFSFPVDKRITGEHIIQIFFNHHFYSDLSVYGKATKISPDKVCITIKCNKNNLSFNADPPVMSDNGMIQIKAEEIVDTDRIKEIEEESKRADAEKHRAELEEATKTRAEAIKRAKGKKILKSLGIRYQSVKFLSAYLSNEYGIVPKKGYLYPAHFIIAIQQMDNGYLITANPRYYDSGDYSHPGVAFLYTTRRFSENSDVGKYAYYVGKYKYQTIAGFQKEISAFKLLDDIYLENRLGYPPSDIDLPERFIKQDYKNK